MPDFRRGEGRVLTFKAGPQPSVPNQVNVLIEYVRAESARIQFHYFVAFPRELEFIN